MTDYNLLFPDKRHTGETKLRQAQLVMLRMLRIIDDICKKHGLSYWLCSGTLLGAVRHKGFIPWDDDLDICMPREDYEQFLIFAGNEFPEDMFLQTRETDPLYDYLPLPCKVRDKKSLIIAKGQENKKYCMGIFIDIFPFDKYHLDRFSFGKERCVKNVFYFLCKGVDCELSKDKALINRIVYYFNPLFRTIIKHYLKKIQPMIKKNSLLGENCHLGHGFDTPWRRFFNYDDIYPLREIEFEGCKVMMPQNPKAYLIELYGESYMQLPPEDKRVNRHAVILEPILPKQ